MTGRSALPITCTLLLILALLDRSAASIIGSSDGRSRLVRNTGTNNQDKDNLSNLASLNGLTTTELQIIRGELLLVRLDISDDAYDIDGKASYEGQVRGVFCRMSMKEQKDDPSKVPFFMSMTRKNKCGNPKNHVTVDLHDIVGKAEAHDNDVDSVAGRENDDVGRGRSVKPTGFLYHEGRCGSTLVSNSVTALDSAKTRTYSEPNVALQALLACHKSRVNCNVEKAATLFRDVVFMMGRTHDPNEERMFLKLLPSSVLAVDVIKKAYPDTPWVFIYRDPVHVMVSNLRDPGPEKGPGPYCVDGMRHEDLHDEFTADIASRAGKSVGNLTLEEYCAAHLFICSLAQGHYIVGHHWRHSYEISDIPSHAIAASMTESALEEMIFSDDQGGMVVNYEDMPGVLLDTVFPVHFRLPVDDEGYDNVMSQFGVYSKRHKSRNLNKKNFNDSLEKEHEASIETRRAVSMFMTESYVQLNAVKNGNVESVVSKKRSRRDLTDRFQDASGSSSSSSLWGGKDFGAPVIYHPLKAARRLQVCTVPDDTPNICCPAGSTRQLTGAAPFYNQTGAFSGCYFNYMACSNFAKDGPCVRGMLSEGPFYCSGNTFFYEASIEPSAFLPVFEDFVRPLCEANRTAVPTDAPTGEPVASTTVMPTSQPTATPMTQATAMPMIQTTVTPTAQPTAMTQTTATPMAQPTAMPMAQVTAMPTATPMAEATAMPTATPMAQPTATPMAQPTATPMAQPTAMPTATPMAQPTATPTAMPGASQAASVSFTSSLLVLLSVVIAAAVL